jgi:hypothetical protein
MPAGFSKTLPYYEFIHTFAALQNACTGAVAFLI